MRCGLLHSILRQDVFELCEACTLPGTTADTSLTPSSIMGLPITGQNYNLVSLAFYVGVWRSHDCIDWRLDMLSQGFSFGSFLPCTSRKGRGLRNTWVRFSRIPFRVAVVLIDATRWKYCSLGCNPDVARSGPHLRRLLRLAVPSRLAASVSVSTCRV
jgi:hypothetical protein